MNRIRRDIDISDWHKLDEFYEKYPIYFKEAIKDHDGKCFFTGAKIVKGDVICFFMVPKPSETEKRKVKLDDGVEFEVPEMEVWVEQMNVKSFLSSGLIDEYYFAKNDSNAIALAAQARNF